MLSRLSRFIRNTLGVARGMLSGLNSGLSSLRNGTGFLTGLESSLREARLELEKSLAAATDNDRRMLYLCVGHAISTWARMEEMLLGVASLLLRVPMHKGGIVMYSIINFYTWLSLIDDLFEQDEDLKPFKKRWNQISERIRRNKDKRDAIAHHSVITNDKLLNSAYLHRSKFDMRLKSKSQRPLNIEEITEFTNTIDSIAQDLGALLAAMFEALDASQRKSAEPDSGRSQA